MILDTWPPDPLPSFGRWLIAERPELDSQGVRRALDAARAIESWAAARSIELSARHAVATAAGFNLEHPGSERAVGIYLFWRVVEFAPAVAECVS